MKLVIQIPCFNEEETLPAVVADLPESVPGFDTVEYLVIDDGSSDRTVEVARSLGVHHVVSLGNNRGLATAFRRGVQHAIGLGADVVVNTDGDDQYPGADIPNLVRPILENRADLVVGCRPIKDHPEFGFIKKILQTAGSWTLRKISKTDVRDAASGFRAFSREACQRLYVFSRFSYCMETLIQAGNSGLRVGSVDVGVNPKTRDSRLFRSIPEYLYKSGVTMLAMFILYRPGRFFTILASIFLAVAFAVGMRFIVIVYWLGHPDPTRQYTPSLILLAVCALTGVLFLGLGVLGELLKAIRQLQQEQLFLERRATTPDQLTPRNQ
jgi:glycosyltransferase involved in cell wall biosynthesis